MKKAWWRSWTVWIALGSIAVCWVPCVSTFIHQASYKLVQAQALMHLLLRMKTSAPIGRPAPAAKQA